MGDSSKTRNGKHQVRLAALLALLLLLALLIPLPALAEGPQVTLPTSTLGFDLQQSPVVERVSPDFGYPQYRVIAESAQLCCGDSVTLVARAEYRWCRPWRGCGDWKPHTAWPAVIFFSDFDNASCECGTANYLGYAQTDTSDGRATFQYTPNCSRSSWRASWLLGGTSCATLTFDTSPPQITCPSDLTLECNDPQGQLKLDAWLDRATASDDYDVSLSISDNAPSFSALPVECASDASGTVVTFMVTDDCDNSSTCTATVYVLDTTPPVITCPADIAIECDESTDPSNTGSATATDNCDPNPTVTYNDLQQSASVLVPVGGDCEQEYSFIRAWTATDECGNSSTCEQVITVQDTTPPTFDQQCPADATVECDSVPIAPILTVTDNCGTASVSFNETRTDGDCADSYTLTRTWTALDDCENETVCTQVITVQDTTSPTFDQQCPTDVTIECDAVLPIAPTLTATDNCDEDVPVVFGEVRTDGNCPDSYTLTRTWTATDDCENETVCIQVITVQDTTSPTFDQQCPTDVTVECDAALPIAPTLTATDNCDDDVPVVFGEVRTDGNCADSYTLTRTWTAIDDCENEAICTQIITVQDTTSPEIVCPPDADLELGESTDPSNTGSATATDNCDPSPTIAYSDATIGTCPTVIERTWTATDECGNEAICVQTINVNDVPTVTVNDAAVCDGGSATLTATTVPDTGVSYLWNTAETTQSIIVSTAGIYTVTVTLDETGCQASDSGTFTVNAAPTAGFSSDSPIYVTEAVHFTDESVKGDWPIVSWAWDFGDSVGTSTQQNPSYTYNSVGTYFVTLTVTDEFGCTDTVQHPVTVMPLPTRYICGYVRLDGTTTGLPDAVVKLEVHWNGYWHNAGTYTTGPDGFFEFNYTGLMTMFRLTETNPPGHESTYAVPIMWGEAIDADLIRFNHPPLTPPDLCHFIFYDKLTPGPGPSSIGDYVWHDRDGDRIQDADEEPLAHITVYLKSPDGTIPAVTETDENGLYLFEGLAPGTYHVEVDVDDPDLPLDFSPTTPVLDIVNLGVEEEYRDADFGFNASCPLCPDWFTFHTNRDGNWEIYRMGDGTPGDLLNLTNNPATDLGPTRSPDADWIAYQSDRCGNWDVFLVQAAGEETKQLTYNPANDKDPNWSGECDIRRIAFQSDREGQWEIYIINIDGTGLRRITFNNGTDSDPSWSPDCNSGKIAFQSDRDGNWNIYIVGVDTCKEYVLVDNPAQDTDPSWSPDGNTIAFISDRDGQQEVYVVDVATGNETRISYSEGNESNIAWSPDGFWLAYQSDRNDQWEIYVARSNGQREMRVTDNTFVDEAPSWDCGSEWIVFHSDMDGNPEIYGINGLTGEGLNRKTNNPASDVYPMWMPSEEDGSLGGITPARGLVLAKGW